MSTLAPNVPEKSRRHSFEPQSSSDLPTNFRHTQSHNYGSSKLKKMKQRKENPPAIPEAEPEESVDATNQHIRISITNVDERKSTNKNRQIRGSARSINSSTSSHSRRAYDNAGFVPDRPVSRSNSTANSVRSSTSVQSLSGVVKEQYCCCSQRTPCERMLLAAVGVLSCIIVILIVVIILISKTDTGNGPKTLLQQIFPNNKS